MSKNVLTCPKHVQKCAYVVYGWPHSNEVSLTDFTCPTVDSTSTTTHANFKSLDDQTLILTNTWDGNSHIFRADYGKYQSSYVLNRPQKLEKIIQFSNFVVFSEYVHSNLFNRSWHISTTPNTTNNFLIIFKLIQQAIMVILSCLVKKNQNLNSKKS